MVKKLTVVFLFVLMALGIAVAIANFISVHAHAAIPCIQVNYQSDPVDCTGPGASCWDCTPNPPKD
jgi:hypothetical protein